MADGVIQDIRDRLDVVDVVSSYIALKRAGTNYKASCPFHSEKSASFIVSPQKQIWHCFGCGEGGDIFGFVMKYEGLEFKEALQQLAQKAGVTLPEYSGKSAEAKDVEATLLRINKFAARYYHEYLIRSPQASTAREYVAKRGLTQETIAQWQIGYAPNDFHGLEKALAGKVSQQLLVQAGVSVKNEKGMVYDRFRDRVTFPIMNYYGEAVGFSARILNNDPQAAKYINSPETSIYNKSAVLFGLYFAKQAIRHADAAVIVEGQMDCIKAHQAGYAHTVATSGTALTEQQLKMIGRLTKNITFCFDGDAAGLKAAHRAGELALPMGFKIKMLVLTEAKDPDELISKDTTRWGVLLEGAPWFLDVYLERGVREFSFGSIEQKHYLQEYVVPLLGALTDPFERQHYTSKLQDMFRIDPATLAEALKASSVARAVEVTTVRGAIQATALGVSGTAVLLEKQIVGGMLLSGEFLDFLRSATVVPVFHTAALADASHRLLSGEAVFDTEAEVREALFMAEQALESFEGNRNAFFHSLVKAYYSFLSQDLKRKQTELSGRLQQAELLGDKVLLDELRTEFALIAKQRLEIDGKL